MIERNIGDRSDNYLRREDTFLAKTLKRISPKEGKEYRESLEKRTFEVIVAAPAALSTLPLLGAFALAKKLEDGQSAFYIQERVAKDKTVPVIKIRCMRVNADKDMGANLKNGKQFSPETDPRNTKLGSFMRKYELEELPQLWQVLGGQLRLVDFRAFPQYAFDYLREIRPNTIDEWEKAYKESSKPGVFNLNAAVNDCQKDSNKRHHYDLLYARRASLGLDMFILYKTGRRIIKKATQKKFF